MQVERNFFIWEFGISMLSEDQESENNSISLKEIAKEITCISLFLFLSSFIGSLITRDIHQIIYHSL